MATRDEDIARLRGRGPSDGQLPLEGIRVIDMTVVWAGPFGSALLGDMGAEVIRVETVQHWDLNNRNPGNPAASVRANGCRRAAGRDALGDQRPTGTASAATRRA